MQNRLRELRLDKGLTQASIAKGFGVTQQAISLDEHGIRRAGSVRVRSEDSMSLDYNAVCYVIKTKYGFMCSLNSGDVLTYMGDGIWDLRVAEETKITDEELKRVLSEPDKEF